MPLTRRACLLFCLIAAMAGTPGCLVRRRVIARQNSPTGKPRALITISREDLVRRMTRQNDAIRSFNATVDMTPSLGSVYKGAITEYKDVRAYVVFRKPVEIRIIGLYPLVRSKAFDMVSNGESFKILIPSKSRFVEGSNDAPPVSKNNLENLRPEAFVDAMLIPPPKAAETPLLVDNTDEDAAQYILVMTGKKPNGDLMITRSVFFDRTTLLVLRQKQYDAQGIILSDTRYSNWKSSDGIAFPYTIDINRPEDGYGVVMNVVKLDMNAKVTDDKFVLEKPEGVQLQVIGGAPAGPAK